MSLRTLPKPLMILAVLYLLASLGHFAHNAEFICTYPNLPVWLDRGTVYAAWLAVTSVGLLGLLLLRAGRPVAGLLMLGVYAALGFDGLGHYAVAPMALHTPVANLTILTEVFMGALLLVATGLVLVRHLHALHRARRCA